MNYKHFKHFRESIVLKMLIVQMNGYTLFFPADRQHTDNGHNTLYVQNGVSMGNRGNRHKIHKKHSDMNHLNFPHFQHNRIWKMRKMLKVHALRIAEICLLSLLHLLSHKKPKRCKIHIPKNMNYQHFRHDRGAMMLIVHNLVDIGYSEKR